MGDQCLYFRLGHQRYFEAVAEKDVYKVNPRDKPWERTHVYECELVKVVGIKYVIKPPRVASLRLACSLGARSLTVRYHDMPDVIDFLVLRQQYDAAVRRRWGAGDRFRCMIDDCWWTGQVLENTGGDPAAGDSAAAAGLAGPAAEAWAAAAASHFLSLRVRWDNSEVERLSPWDLEPLDPERLPAVAGGAVAVLPHELEAALYRAEPAEWPPRGDRAAACRAIAQHIGCVMSLAAAEPFVAPVDLQQYPAYARVVPYPIDLATIRARFDNLFYRRAAAAQFDVRYLASNAEQFNQPHSPIVRQARLVTDLLLRIIAAWRDVDVLAIYRDLAAAYHSSDDEPLRPPAKSTSRSRARGEWRGACGNMLTELMASADAEPFRQPVAPEQAPDYCRVVSVPMDLGTVRTRLLEGTYSRPEQFASDVRLVFSNSRLYNTNKRSRIYSMTVRLSALFEALWSRYSSATAHAPRRPGRAARAQRSTRRTRRTMGNNELVNGACAAGAESGSSDSETLAATSRRVHARDSWDSDAPLHVHRKGKGVGKKSKSSSASAEPVPSTSRAPPAECYVAVNGSACSADERSARSDSSSERSHIRVVEEELQDDEVELTYDSGASRARARKRRLASSDSSAAARRPHPHRAPAKRTRERFAEATSSSSSCSSGSSAGSARRYESDRSYRPRYSTDDDAPLHLYRTRHDPAAPVAAPPRRRHTGAGVSLRARRSRRQYNEDSEEDSVAAISKRLQHHHHSRTHHAHQASRRRHHAEQSASAEGSAGAHTSDHNYFNGHASHASHRPHASHAAPTTNGNGSAVDGSGGSNGSSAGGAGSAAPGGVSISSRGRVRKLTAKARGLLRD